MHCTADADAPAQPTANSDGSAAFEPPGEGIPHTPLDTGTSSTAGQSEGVIEADDDTDSGRGSGDGDVGNPAGAARRSWVFVVVVVAVAVAALVAAVAGVVVLQRRRLAGTAAARPNADGTAAVGPGERGSARSAWRDGRSTPASRSSHAASSEGAAVHDSGVQLPLRFSVATADEAARGGHRQNKSRRGKKLRATRRSRASL